MSYLQKLRDWSLAAAIGCACPYAFAQQNEECKEISSVVNAGMAIEEKLLSNADASIPCLANEMDKVGAQVGFFDRATSAKMLSATGALRNIMAGVSSPNGQQISPELRRYIDEFRRVADKHLNIVSALTFGMRDDDPNLRLNSVLITGNVIDDNTVCVPLTQLNDKGLAATPVGVRGRANLLSVISVVAPWATKQNFDTMSATTAKITSVINRDDPNFTSTVSLLDNIKKRLESQTTETNKKYPIEEGQLDLCERYIRSLKSKFVLDDDNLKY